MSASDVALRPRGAGALLEAVDEIEQLVAFPDAPPSALVEPLQDFRLFELLQGFADRHVGLTGEPPGDPDVNHRLLRQDADELANRGVPARAAEIVEPL